MTEGQPSSNYRILIPGRQLPRQTRCSPCPKRARLVDVACALCGSEDDPTTEDVVPKWLLRAFSVDRGSTIVSVGEQVGSTQQVGTLGHFQVTLDKGLCRKCNNQRLGGLEQLVHPILGPMVRGKRTTLDPATQCDRGVHRPVPAARHGQRQEGGTARRTGRPAPLRAFVRGLVSGRRMPALTWS
jgi:hypothetical protein